jgi:transcriptional regulator with XRE-family HTH domain
MARGGSRAVEQRRLRTELRRLREHAGHTQKAVAERLNWSISKVIRIETGAVRASTSDVRALLHFYELSDPDRTRDLIAITQTNSEAWWDEYRSFYKQPFLDFLDYEDSAIGIRQYIGSVVPGLLQTEEYMRSIFAYYDYETEQFERAVYMRQRRQKLLDPELGRQTWFIIDEAALRRWIGGREVIVRQLAHLKEMAKRPNVNIQMVPFSVGMHAGIPGGFTIFEIPTTEDEYVLYLETPRHDDIIRDDLETTSEFLESFYRLEEAATPTEELDKVLDDLAESMRLDT